MYVWGVQSWWLPLGATTLLASCDKTTPLMDDTHHKCAPNTPTPPPNHPLNSTHRHRQSYMAALQATWFRICNTNILNSLFPTTLHVLNLREKIPTTNCSSKFMFKCEMVSAATAMSADLRVGKSPDRRRRRRRRV